MLIDFVVRHREELIARTRTKVAKRLAPKATDDELTTGVPLFLEQLVDTLRRHPSPRSEAMNLTAAAHGEALLGLGYTVGQVVHDYGDICQAITELAETVDESISTDE